MRSDSIPTLDRISLTAFLDALPHEVVVLDSGGVVLAVNDAWRSFCQENGGDTSAYVGLNYLDVCQTASGPSSAEAAMVPDGLQRTLGTGEPFSCEYPCDSPSEKRWFEMTATRIVQDGEAFLAVQHRNITTRRAEQVALQRAEHDNNMLAALVAGTTDAVLSYDLGGRIITWNPAAEELYGYTAEEAIGQSLELLYPPDWPHPVTYYRDLIIAGKLRRFEATRIAKDGTPREVWISGAPVRDAEGAVVAVSNIHRDVSELRKAEKEREMLAREVVHRAKNMLTIVSSVQRQTARQETTIEGFHRSFGARITALAKSTDLLVGGSWSSVGLRSLIAGHLETFAGPGDARIEVTGPEVMLEPQAVQTIGVALHELATNAMKYGALAHDDGRISIRWEVDGPALRLEWIETGLAQPPGEGAGFGSSVLTRLAPTMLGTESCYEMDASGVRWGIEIDGEHFSLSD
ncbi:PAS domain S-box protein [Antarctobacter jejuensis]|uniref:PAS domain S-box protein n=1 Tax=Antarctobacter jejuensis TaxID=1439938 RepID=UPI003FD19E14